MMLFEFKMTILWKQRNSNGKTTQMVQYVYISFKNNTSKYAIPFYLLYLKLYM
jgi:hypothetical protein